MAKEIKPVSPTDIVKNLEFIIPPVVIEAVNNLLIKKFRGDGRVILLQKDIVAEIKRLDSTMTSEALFENHWMDFEDVYRKNGWKVTYDKPAYCESYEANFTFESKIKLKK